MKKYIVNGREYQSLDEVPAELRALLEDKDGDGVPDFIRDQLQPGSTTVVTSTTSVYHVNGKTYTSLDQVPAEFRSMLEDRDGNGLPDFIEGKLGDRFGSSPAGNGFKSVFAAANGSGPGPRPGAPDNFPGAVPDPPDQFSLDPRKRYSHNPGSGRKKSWFRRLLSRLSGEE